MQPIHPVMGIDEDPEPDEHHPIVDADTPEKNSFDLIRNHGITSFGIYVNVSVIYTTAYARKMHTSTGYRVCITFA